MIIYEGTNNLVSGAFLKCFSMYRILYEPRPEQTGLRGFRLGPIQTGLYSHRRWLEA